MMKLIQNAILLAMVALCASCDSRPATDLAFYVQQSDIVVHGKVRDMNSLNKDNVNRYWGANDTTIKRFIKARRLELANRKLLAADPGETNVTQIAMDTGFDQLGRFSLDYKQAFGELPSETLYR